MWLFLRQRELRLFVKTYECALLFLVRWRAMKMASHFACRVLWFLVEHLLHLLYVTCEVVDS